MDGGPNVHGAGGFHRSTRRTDDVGCRPQGSRTAPSAHPARRTQWEDHPGCEDPRCAAPATATSTCCAMARTAAAATRPESRGSRPLCAAALAGLLALPLNNRIALVYAPLD